MKNNRYAYVIHIKSYKYISHAIVFAHSIRKHGSVIDIIAIMKNDIDNKYIDECKHILGSYFTHIFNNIDELKQYEKILVVNSILLPIKQTDRIFDYDIQNSSIKKNKNNDIVLVLPNNKHVDIDVGKYFINYDNKKELPFKKSTHVIKNKVSNDNFVIWHELYHEILECYPEFKQYEILNIVNEIHLYFHSVVTKVKKKKLLSRENINHDKNIISKVFQIDENEINDAHIQYYHTERDIDFVPRELEPMWNDIREYDYMEPIKRLAQYYGEKSYYCKLVKMYDENFVNKAEKLDKQISNYLNNPIDKDCIMLEYIKCRPHMCVVTLWPMLTNKMKLDDITKLLEKYGDICYIKTLTLKKQALYNLMYWVYNEYTYSYRIDFITKHIEYIDASHLNEITVIFFDRVNNDIVMDKKELVHGLLVNMNNNNNIPITGDELIYINTDFYQTIEYGQIVLNKNSIDLLDVQNNNNIADSLMTESNLKIQTFRKWCLLNLSLLEIGRVLFTNDILLYSYGFRKINNVDAIFISVNNDESQSESELKELIYTNFNDSKKKFFCIDIAIEKSEYWHESWTEKNNEILTTLEIDDFIELSTDPQNYYYFQGIKCPTLPFEIIKKIQHNRAQDQADFIILSTLYPKILSQYVQFNKGTLIYKKNVGTVPPTLNHEYLKKLLYLISKQYLKKDIDALRKLAKV
jgi:hypothetical protein